MLILFIHSTVVCSLLLEDAGDTGVNRPDGSGLQGAPRPVGEGTPTQIAVMQGGGWGEVCSSVCEDLRERERERDGVPEGHPEEGTFQLGLNGKEEGAAR